MPAFPDLVIAFEEKTPYSTLQIQARSQEQVSAFRAVFELLAMSQTERQVIDAGFATLAPPLGRLVLETDAEESWIDARLDVKSGTIAIHWSCTGRDWLTTVAMLDSLTGGQEKRYLPPDDTRYPIEIEFSFTNAGLS